MLAHFSTFCEFTYRWDYLYYLHAWRICRRIVSTCRAQAAHIRNSTRNRKLARCEQLDFYGMNVGELHNGRIQIKARYLAWIYVWEEVFWKMPIWLDSWKRIRKVYVKNLMDLKAIWGNSPFANVRDGESTSFLFQCWFQINKIVSQV